MISFDRPRLSELFVYCPRLCQREGQEQKKILFYFPANKSINDQINSVGLCEALVSFTRFFDSECQSFHTSTTRRFLRPVASGVWAAMVIALPPPPPPPHSSGTGGSSDHYSLYHEQDADLSDQVMGAILCNACQTFELFNGKIDCLLDTNDEDTVRQRLNHFFSRYLRVMLFDHCDLLDCFNGIQLTTVTPSDFARIHGFLSRARYAFRAIKHLAFFYDGRLVVATMELDYARHLYEYLNSFLFVEQPDASHSAAGTTRHKHFGRYLVGPKDFSDLSKQSQCPVLCSPGSPLPDAQLVTYQALRVVLCIVVDGIAPIPMKFFAQFDAMVGPRLTMLADRIAANHLSSLPSGFAFSRHPVDESFNPAPVYLSALGAVHTVEEGLDVAVEHLAETGLSVTSDSELSRSIARFVYWNPSLCSVLSTLHVFTGSGRRPIAGSKMVLNLMVSVRAELHLRPLTWHEEVIVRLDPHLWLVARRSNGRELYMVFVRKQDSLAKVDLYVDHLYQTSFRGLLLLN